jgi:hypothetical protein
MWSRPSYPAFSNRKHWEARCDLCPLPGYFIISSLCRSAGESRWGTLPFCWWWSSVCTVLLSHPPPPPAVGGGGESWKESRNNSPSLLRKHGRDIEWRMYVVLVNHVLKLEHMRRKKQWHTGGEQTKGQTKTWPRDKHDKRKKEQQIGKDQDRQTYKTRHVA